MAQYPASATSKLLITKSNTAGEASLGTAGLTGASGTTAYGQISAALASDTLVTAVQVYLSAGNFGVDITEVDIAYGGAGAETVLATILPEAAYNGSVFRRAVGRLSIPVRVASGARLAVRFTDSNVPNTTTVTVKVFGVPYANLEGN